MSNRVGNGNRRRCRPVGVPLPCRFLHDHDLVRLVVEPPDSDRPHVASGSDDGMPGFRLWLRPIAVHNGTHGGEPVDERGPRPL